MSAMPQPWVLINRQDDGTWRYRWWDSAADWVAADLPTRDKVFEVAQQTLSAFLADLGRVKLNAGTFWDAIPGLDDH